MAGCAAVTRDMLVAVWRSVGTILKLISMSMPPPPTTRSDATMTGPADAPRSPARRPSPELIVHYDRHTVGRVTVTPDGMVVLSALAAPPFARRPMASDQLRPSRTFLRNEVDRYPAEIRAKLIESRPFVGTSFHPVLMFAFMDHYQCTGDDVRAALRRMCAECDDKRGVDTSEYVSRAENAHAQYVQSRARMSRIVGTDQSGDSHHHGPAAGATAAPAVAQVPTTSECHICYEDCATGTLVSCETCTCVCCRVCLEEMLRVAAATARTIFSCPVCRSGLKAPKCLRSLRIKVLRRDLSVYMPWILQAGATIIGDGGAVSLASIHPYVVEAYHDIVFVWGGVRFLMDEGQTREGGDDAYAADDGSQMSLESEMELAKTDGFDTMDVVPFSALTRTQFGDYALMWRYARRAMGDGGLVVLDPVLEEGDDKAHVLILHAGQMVSVMGAAKDAIVLATRAKRRTAAVPLHRRNHRVITFGHLCALRSQFHRIACLERSAAAPVV